MNLFMRFLKLSVIVTALTLLQAGGAMAKTISPDFVELAKKAEAGGSQHQYSQDHCPAEKDAAPSQFLRPGPF